MSIEVVGMLFGGVVTVGTAIFMMFLIKHYNKPPSWELPETKTYNCTSCSYEDKSPLK